MLTDKDLAEIEARCEAATPGPWVGYEEDFAIDDGETPDLRMHFASVSADNRNLFRMTGSRLSDAIFIAHARTDIPAFLAEVKRLRAENAALIAKGDRQREELNFCAERIRRLKLRSRKYRHDKRDALQARDLADDEIARLREWQKEAIRLCERVEAEGGHGHRIHEAVRKLVADVRE